MNVKEKGNRYERLITKDLSLWWSNGKSKDIFYKTQSSGGRATIRQKRKNEKKLIRQYGDIAASDPDGELFISVFCIECKHYKDVNFWGLMTDSKGGLLSFYEQNIKDSSSCNKLPLCIIRQNYKPILCITKYSICTQILKNIFSIPMLLSTKYELGVFSFNDFIKTDIDKFKDVLRYLRGEILMDIGDLNDKIEIRSS